MIELTSGIFNSAKSIYNNNKGSILRTIVYTIGHFAIAITVLMLIADVSFMIALTDAIVEPLSECCLVFLLDKFWASKVKKIKLSPHKLSFLTHPLYISDLALHHLSLHFMILTRRPLCKIAIGLEYKVGFLNMKLFSFIIIAAFFLIIERCVSNLYYFHDLVFF